MAVAALTSLLRTLSDPTRLRLMRLMAGHELSVMELAEVTQLAQSRISNHLKVLRDEGLVQERRDGAWRHYRVDVERLDPPVRAVWDPIRDAMGEDDEALADRARLERVLARRENRNGFFESLADQWDDIRSELFGDSIAREVLRAFLPGDLTVADIGCGTGFTIELFGARPRKLIGIDASEAMLAVARRKVAALGLRNVELREGDAHDPPLARGEANVVTLVMVLHYLEEPLVALEAAARRLASGGRLIVVDFCEHQQTWLRDVMQHRRLGFSRGELETVFAACGLDLDAWASLPGRSWTTPDNRKVQVPDGFAAVARAR